MATDLSLYEVDLTTSQPNNRSGESARSAFTKYNDLLDVVGGWDQGTYLSTTEPSEPFAYQEWLNTSEGIIYRRNSANTAWNEIGSYEYTLGTAAGYDYSDTPTGNVIPTVNSDGELSPQWFDFSIWDKKPEVSIPFNDGLRIENGYGTNDIITVDGVDYALPTKSVDFSRSSTSTVINKSGVLTDLAADEAGIGSDGIWLHGSYSNELLRSNDITYGIWAKTNCTASGVNELTVTGSSPNIQQVYTTTSGSYYCFQVKIKSSDVDYVTVRAGSAFTDLGETVFNISDGTVFSTSASTLAGVSDCADGYKLCYIIGEGTGSAGGFRVAPMYSSSSTTFTTTGQVVNVKEFQLSETFYLTPYLETETSTSTAAATTCTVPVENNMPAAGESLTFIVDTTAPKTYPSGNRTLFYVNADSRYFRGFLINADGFLICRTGSDSDSDLALGKVTDSEVKRIAVTYDSENLTLTMYENGVYVTQKTLPSAMTLPYEGDIYLGVTSGTWYLNSQIKNFKIYHRALTSAEVAALGSAS